MLASVAQIPIPAAPAANTAPLAGFWVAAAVALVCATLLVLRFAPLKAHPSPTLTTLTSYPGRQEFPALSPDGTEVAFAWTSDEHPIRHIYVTSLHGGDPQALTSGPTSDSIPESSPDATQNAFKRDSRWLKLEERRGGREPQLSDGNSTWRATSTEQEK